MACTESRWHQPPGICIQGDFCNSLSSRPDSPGTTQSVANLMSECLHIKILPISMVVRVSKRHKLVTISVRLFDVNCKHSHGFVLSDTLSACHNTSPSIAPWAESHLQCVISCTQWVWHCNCHLPNPVSTYQCSNTATDRASVSQQAAQIQEMRHLIVSIADELS